MSHPECGASCRLNALRLGLDDLDQHERCNVDPYMADALPHMIQACSSITHILVSAPRVWPAPALVHHDVWLPRCCVQDDVLHIAKIDAGELQLVFQPVQPVQLVHTAVATFLPHAKLKGKQLHVEIDASGYDASGVPVTVLADPHRLAQVINNILACVHAQACTDTHTRSATHEPSDARAHVQQRHSV